jgi:hypothetical protein
VKPFLLLRLCWAFHSKSRLTTGTYRATKQADQSFLKPPKKVATMSLSCAVDTSTLLPRKLAPATLSHIVAMAWIWPQKLAEAVIGVLYDADLMSYVFSYLGNGDENTHNHVITLKDARQIRSTLSHVRTFWKRICDERFPLLLGTLRVTYSEIEEELDWVLQNSSMPVEIWIRESGNKRELFVSERVPWDA